MAVHDEDPGLPIKLHPVSNTEVPPPPPSPVAREAIRRAREACETNARRIGISRRQFMLSAMGSATTLLALAACTDEANRAASTTGRGATTTSRASSTTAGGTFTIPEEATTEPDVATTLLGTDHPVIDVQTHFIEIPEGLDESSFGWAGVFPQSSCGEASSVDCFNLEHFALELFTRSDTTMGVLSALPLPKALDAMAADKMKQVRDTLAGLCGEERLLQQGHAQPNWVDIEEVFADMEAEAAEHHIVAWKTYTHTGPGWFLDDHDPDAPAGAVGEQLLAKIEELGTPVICVHKGLAALGTGSTEFADPVDVGPAATAHPDLSFVIYHSGYETSSTEGPYRSTRPNQGIDRLVKTLEQHRIGAGGNVYAELGSTWRFLMADPDQAAHALGKLLVAVGEDNILWGTDSIWYGSPQDQIQALRAFEIRPELQERYGYPALTDEIKAKIFWRNAARLHGIDPASMPCRIDPGELEENRRSSLIGNTTFGPRTAAQSSAWFRADHPWAFR
jgi:predicted TIM-barrel fold metal-dependent hydrolase